MEEEAEVSEAIVVVANVVVPTTERVPKDESDEVAVMELDVRL